VLDEQKTGAKVGMLVDEVVAVTAYSKEDVNTSIANDSSSYIKGVVEKVTHQANEGERDKIELIVWIETSKFIEEL
jgi:chemotaxis signal transduction protein